MSEEVSPNSWTPKSLPNAKRKSFGKIRAAASEVIKGNHLHKSLGSLASDDGSPSNSPSLAQRKRAEEDIRTKLLITSIMANSSSATSSATRPPLIFAGKPSILGSQNPLLLSKGNAQVIRHLELSERYDRAMERETVLSGGNTDPGQFTFNRFNSRVNSRAPSRSNSRPGSRTGTSTGSRPSLSRGRMRSRPGSRPGTVGEVLAGDVFQSIEDSVETSVDLPLVQIVSVDVKERTATDSRLHTHSFSSLLNPAMYRRVINSNKMGTATMADSGSTGAEVWFEDSFAASLPPSTATVSEISTGASEPQERRSFSHLEKAVMSTNIQEAREGFFELSKRLRQDKDLLQSDPRRIFIQCCRETGLAPLPILVRCMREAGTVLDLTDQMVGPEYCDALAAAIKEMPFLRTLNLTSNKMDGTSVMRILEVLPSIHVHNLTLDKNKGVGKIFVNLVSRMIKEQRKQGFGENGFPRGLMALSMNATSLGDSGIRELSAHLLSFGALSSLSIQENQCTAFAMTSIAHYLGSDGCQLQHLDLSWNNIRTAGAVELINAVSSKNSRLHTLKLDWNGLSDEFLSPLEKFMISSPNTSLRYMSLCNNLLSVQRLKTMENHRVDLEICYSEIQFTSRLG